MQPQLHAAHRVAHQYPRWTIHFRTPGTWERHVECFGGGYFHSPVALDAIAMPGQPVWFQWRSGSTTIGIATGLRQSCRLSGVPLHVYLPTLPVVASGWSWQGALRSLIASLRAGRIAELTCDSFHADGLPPLDTAPVEIRRRFEYMLELGASTPALFDRWDREHRGQLEAAGEYGWVLAMPAGDDARHLVGAVSRDAAPPAAAVDKGPFLGAADIDLALGTADLSEPWGRAAFVALEDGRPLALAVVGWANRRAFHLLEFVTRAGRERPVMTWLYAQIVRMLSDHGFTSYHLGGVPAPVVDSASATFAFHHSRLGMGAVPVFSASARWVLDASHLALHRATTRVEEAVVV